MRLPNTQRVGVRQGHQDFSEDTYRTLAAADNAVMLVDGAKGLEPQTRKLFEVVRMRCAPGHRTPAADAVQLAWGAGSISSAVFARHVIGLLVVSAKGPFLWLLVLKPAQLISLKSCQSPHSFLRHQT